MKVATLFSGGKDSVFAAFLCQQAGFDVELLSVVPAEYSTMFHFPNIKWCRLQAKRMGLKITFVQPNKKTEEGELAALKAALAKIKADAVACGAIESEYQKERIDRIAHELGIPSFSPIWRKGEKLLEEQCKYLEAYIVAVAAEGLDESFLGKKFDAQFVEYAKTSRLKISPHLEGGEGETFVVNAPFFSRPIMIKKVEKKFDGSFGVAKILSAK
ncbi:MAG: diphthine--ammonia ligase [Candidatus Anstonellaceae archaeon]